MLVNLRKELATTQKNFMKGAVKFLNVFSNSSHHSIVRNLNLVITMAKASTKKRKVIIESTGEAHINATFNNIIISLTNKKGEVISWSSAGKMGFRGSKKNTPYAAQMAAEDCSRVALEAGLKKVKVYVKGPGNGRESAIRSIHNSGVEVTEIIDVTPMPHNGCRPPKRRRV